MQKLYLFILFTLPLSLASAQSTGIEVYNIMQTYCSACHNANNPPAGLNLVGEGSSTAQRWASVYQNIVKTDFSPGNPNASGGPVVMPGRPDQSFLFRKINQGLDETLILAESEGQSMPPMDQNQPSEREIEMIRQWILFGAPQSTQVVDPNLIADYYENGGQMAFPDGAPEAPDPAEGFQIKMGPFYLEPGGEKEYFQRYALDLPADTEVTRLEVKMSPFSHHFIMYDWGPGGDAQVPHGLREFSFHSDINLVAAVQAAEDLALPQGTAFSWEEGLVLDLNSHYINYSATMPYQAEVYVNVYTQPAGTAAQEMNSELLVNFNIPIPNNGEEITHTQTINSNAGELFVWGLMGHTHQYGTGYKVWTRENGQIDELIYDAACPQGIPGCTIPFFDYQHIPYRTFEPLRPIRFNFFEGITHQATWINDGPTPLNFGPTSDDEMMVLAIMYTTDTTGIIINNTDEVAAALDRITAYPTPADELARIILPPGLGEVEVILYTTSGQSIGEPITSRANIVEVPRGELSAGLYFYQVRHSSGQIHSGRLVFQ